MTNGKPDTLVELVLSKMKPRDVRYIKSHPVGRLALLSIKWGGSIMGADLVLGRHAFVAAAWGINSNSIKI